MNRQDGIARTQGRTQHGTAKLGVALGWQAITGHQSGGEGPYYQMRGREPCTRRQLMGGHDALSPGNLGSCLYQLYAILQILPLSPFPAQPFHQTNNKHSPQPPKTTPPQETP